MKKLLLLIAILPFMISCEQKFNQPTVLEDNSAFELEKITFNENIPTLYSKHFINDYEFDMEEEYNPNEKLSDTIFRYKIDNIVTETMGFKLPENEFGYLYRTPQLDSVAKYKNVYFHTLNSLTELNKKPVAFYAEAEFADHKMRKQFLNEFIKEYGEPKYSFFIKREYNVCSYEWDFGDRTIQIETSYGWNSSNGIYYRLDMLIVANNSKSAIEKAHILVVPDKIKFEGKLYSYKDFQFEKESKIKDDFLLNSAYEHFIKDETGEYHINNASKDEE
ncbi:hypothetical protein J2X31_003625 [Flavobacterium arsenatis]|uniref:Lipoprotein n=1 Tax=Flavobacterium arsenatis TaxID=1484332 RepID=A0ABU1TUN5_9FLAO|nr:hypothetical protein [Flavobacterium arsenatis]MDR6969592.1 hypothetical protein [Flavobacterium arsenatis]